MFDSKHFDDVRSDYLNSSAVYVFYDRFTKKYGPLNVASSIDEAVYNACNLLKSVEDKNISLSHISVYVCGSADVEKLIYNLHEPVLLFSGADYKEVYSYVLESSQGGF